MKINVGPLLEDGVVEVAPHLCKKVGMGQNHQNTLGKALNRRSTVSTTCYLPNMTTVCR